MRIVFGALFILLMGSVGEAQISWSTLEQTSARFYANKTILKNSISTMTDGVLNTRVSGVCVPLQNEKVTSAYTLAQILPLKREAGVLLIGNFDLSFIGISGSSQSQFGENNAAINITYNFSDFRMPTALVVNSSCWYELCTDDSCSTRTESVMAVSYINEESAEIKTDLKLDEVKIVHESVIPDGAGGYFFKKDYASPDPEVPFQLNVSFKVSGTISWDDAYTTANRAYINVGMAPSPIDYSGLNTVVAVSLSDIFRYGSIWTDVRGGFSFMDSAIPFSTYMYAEINYYRNLVETNYDNNIKAVPLRLSTSEATLSVKEVKLAQVVYNPQIIPPAFTDIGYSRLDLGNMKYFNAVLGKSASFSVKVKYDGDIAKIPHGFYQLQIQNSSGQVLMQSELRPYGEFSVSQEVTISAEEMLPLSPQLSFIPREVGEFSLKAVVVPQSNDVKGVNLEGLVINVVKTYTPSVGLVRIKPSRYLDYAATSESSFLDQMGYSKYLSEVMPVADNSFNYFDGGAVSGTSDSTNFTGSDGKTIRLGEQIDLVTLDFKRVALNLNRAVGLVSDGYFSYHSHASATGVMYPSTPYVALASENNQASITHELGHTFGANYELYKFKGNKLFDGYNANTKGYFKNFGSIKSNRSFMDDDDGKEFVDYTPWIDDRTYSIMFWKMTTPDIDPVTDLVSFVLTDTNDVFYSSIHKIDNGVLTSSESAGDLSITLLDNEGHSLSSLKKTRNFTAIVRPKAGANIQTVVQTRAIPVSVQMPHDESVESVSIQIAGKEIKRLNVDGLEVVSLITRLPLEAFRGIGCFKSRDKDEFRQREKNYLIGLAQKTQKTLDRGEKIKARLAISELIVNTRVYTDSRYNAKDASEVSPKDAISKLEGISKGLSKVRFCKHPHKKDKGR